MSYLLNDRSGRDDVAPVVSPAAVRKVFSTWWMAHRGNVWRQDVKVFSWDGVTLMDAMVQAVCVERIGSVARLQQLLRDADIRDVPALQLAQGLYSLFEDD